MSLILQPWQLYVAIIAGWIHRQGDERRPLAASLALPADKPDEKSTVWPCPSDFDDCVHVFHRCT